jgi:membrane fusion protein, multidrug efflux system
MVRCINEALPPKAYVMKYLRFIEKRPWWIAVAIFGLVVVWMASGAFTGGAPETPETPETPDPALAGGRGETPENPETPDPALVQVREQPAETVMRYVRVHGRTMPARSVGLRAETRGRVVAIEAARGERVKAGDVLVRLDERDRQARLAEARALVRQREAEYEGRQRLGGEGFVSAIQLAEAEAQLEQARAELRRATLDLEHMQIRAPFDGEIQDRSVEVGDFVDPGDPVLSFVDTGTLIAAASVAEQEIALVSPGQTGRARLITGATVEGRLRYIAPVADAATRTFAVELEFDNRTRRLPSGVTAELELPVGELRAQRVSPALLTLDEDGTLGIKLVTDGRVVFVPAEIVHSSPRGVWLAGLPEVATIITVGQGFVQDGQRVATVVEDPPAVVAEER